MYSETTCTHHNALLMMYGYFKYFNLFSRFLILLFIINFCFFWIYPVLCMQYKPCESKFSQHFTIRRRTKSEKSKMTRLNWYLSIADYEIMSLTLVNKSMIVTVKIMSCRLNLFILITLFKQYLCKKHTSTSDARIVKTCTRVTFFI